MKYEAAGADRERYQLIMPDAEKSAELEKWFHVSGDVDDFIFYDEPSRSER